MDEIDPVVRELRELYPSLDDRPIATLAAELQQEMQFVEARTGDRLFEAGKPCAGFPLVLQGEVCVSRSSADGGRTMELYRVGPGAI